MDTFVRFGVGTQAYIPPSNAQVSIQGRFGGVNTGIQRMPGMDGGYNTYRGERAPTARGNVQVIMWLIEESAGEVRAAVDAVLQMASIGESKLYVRGQDGVLRWTWAEVTDVQAAQSVQQMPHLRQQITINFSCPAARWFSRPDLDEPYVWDGTYTAGDAILPLAPRLRYVLAGTTTQTLTNNGNAEALCSVVWDFGQGSGSAPSGVFTLSRDDANGITQDELSITGELAGTAFDENRHMLDAFNGFTFDNVNYAQVTAKRATWLSLPPGDTVVTITQGITGGSGRVLEIDWWDTWT